jgi:hypothetical protein
VSHYADCVKSKYGHSTFEDEDGFFSYSAEKVFYIEEWYLRPEARSMRKAKEYLSKMDAVAKELKYDAVFISINMKAKNDLKDATLFWVLREKYKLSHSNENFIFLKRGVS